MRMFRLPAWISESRGDKLVNGVTDLNMAPATGPAVNGTPGGGLLKRKRGSSEDAPIHDAKRRKPESLGSHVSQMDPVEGQVEGEKAHAVVQGRVRDIIESQFGLEIMLKHEELRLINQELAKCQVALEQLRRCHLIPYQASQGTPESMLNVANGTGATLKKNGNVPQWAPAYGVTDGPYTRHYSKWLIPDPSFDGLQVDMNRGYEGSRAGKTLLEGRATRHSFPVENSTPISKSRSQRNSSGGSQKLQALSNGYPLPKGKAGPSILKRHADGQMVKLVCIDCKREDFSSTQGFINHCRIAHHRDFKSHEEAAIASGQPVEVDESGGIVGEEKTPTSTDSGLVHPLIQTAPADSNAYIDLLSRIEASIALFKQGKLPGVAAIPTRANSTSLKKPHSKPAQTQNKSFVPSSQTPNLSDLLCKKGFSGNLPEIVTDAKKSVDFEEFSSLDEESDGGETPVSRKGMGVSHPAPGMRMPARAAMSPAPLGRPESSKGVDGKNGRFSGISPRLSNATPAINTSAIHMPPSTQSEDHSHHDVGMDVEMTSPSISDLSPNTVASNNAPPPSLVSDDDGDDDAESVSSVEQHDEDDSDVAEIDIEDDGVEKVPRIKSGGLRKEEKHVTFVSPVKESGKERRKK
jgi:ADA HAT complex component 1